MGHPQNTHEIMIKYDFKWSRKTGNPFISAFRTHFDIARYNNQARNGMGWWGKPLHIKGLRDYYTCKIEEGIFMCIQKAVKNGSKKKWKIYIFWLSKEIVTVCACYVSWSYIHFIGGHMTKKAKSNDKNPLSQSSF